MKATKPLKKEAKIRRIRRQQLKEVQPKATSPPLKNADQQQSQHPTDDQIHGELDEVPPRPLPTQ